MNKASIKTFNYEPNAMVILRPNYSYYGKKLVLNIINFIPSEYEYVPGQSLQLEIPIPENLMKLHRTSLKAAVDELTSVKIRTDTKYKYGSLVLFPEVELDFEKNLMKVGIYDKVLPRLIALKKHGFIKYRIEEALNLKKKHSQRLFELLILKNKLEGGTWEISLADFRADMFVEDKYKNQISLFEKRVIFPSIEDINTHTSLIIKYSRIKKNLTFEISDKNEIDESFFFDIDELSEKQRRCWDRLVSFGITDDNLLQYIVLDDEKHKQFWLWLKNNKENIDSGHFRNVGGVILNHLKVNKDTAALFLKRKKDDTQIDMFKEIEEIKKRIND